MRGSVTPIIMTALLRTTPRIFVSSSRKLETLCLALTMVEVSVVQVRQ